MVDTVLAICSLAMLAVALAYTFKTTLNFTRTARWVMLLFPVSQIAIIGYLEYAIATYNLQGGPSIFALALSVLCLASDIALMRAVRSSEEKNFIEEKARLLTEQIHYQEEYAHQLEHEHAQSRLIMDQIAQELDEAGESLGCSDGKAAVKHIEHATSLVECGSHFCSHRAVDALLAMKAAVCKDEGIALNAKVDLPSRAFLPSADLCAMFANALDNAIHACEEMEEAERSIDLEAHVTAGHFVLNVVNSCTPSTVINQDRSRMLDDGIPEHGWGLSIMRHIAQRHDGMLTIEQQGETCKVSIVVRTEEAAA